jgi:hypothetical protein
MMMPAGARSPVDEDPRNEIFSAIGERSMDLMDAMSDPEGDWAILELQLAATKLAGALEGRLEPQAAAGLVCGIALSPYMPDPEPG